MLRPARVLALSLGALALAAAGCASVPDGSIEAAGLECPEGSECYDVPRALGEGGAFTIEAGEFFFENLQGTYWAGDIGVTLDNVGGAEHNIVVVGANEGSDNPVAQALGGEEATGTVNLFEGEYVYYCSIPGHRAQGMEGTLTVYPTEEQAQEELELDPEVETTEGGATEGDTEAPTETETPTDAETSATESESPAATESATEG
jgi:plastocyanin